MEEVINQHFDNNAFATYVADPSTAKNAEVSELKAAIEQYPYCQLLHLFYAQANSEKNSGQEDDILAKTAFILPDRDVLYTLINTPEKLRVEEIVNNSPANFSEDIIDVEIIEEIKEIQVLDVEAGQAKVISEPSQNTVLTTSDSKEAKENEASDVSKYDDDKMPFSFLWWLNKTRKEHADTYQPYVDFKLDTTQNIKRTSVDQLSSQIIENIFHLQSPLENTENAPKTVPFQVRRKEDSILERFIKEEPQIKAPNSQKLDTENKARKSSEDPNDLVSETLARIYIDQMLFQKAIDTYKKLSLKYPEKSAYFADQIVDLQKKIN